MASGSFIAPDHEYPSYLELRLTATDSGGLTGTRTVRLDPRTVVLTFQTTPGGLKLAVNGTQSTATFTRTVIVGSTNTVSAVSPQPKGGTDLQLQRPGRMGGADPHHRRPGDGDHLHGPVPLKIGRGWTLPTRGT